MFIEANNKDGHRILINTDAIAYVDFDAVVYVQKEPREVEESGVRVSFQVSRGDEGKQWPAFQEFTGKEAENLRAGLSKALEANRFS
ncbi:hypothetical protein FD723_18490 [Nostoc sp. C052]|uniref:hypothetical protein n=1 Tax=Nostoc sp. C052 TaxID=2576902 RepID=UPI0015C3ACC5|nr:hypothetical protein [Nostoc sp. C052]QLE42209.1 hypothetical protein FD723_18490 [Nostoc sp. C052]